jgi:hypothetical protein
MGFGLVAFTPRIGLALRGSEMTLESGLDSQVKKENIRGHSIRSIIYPNRRNTKEPIVVARKFRWFNREVYSEGYKVEHTFGCPTRARGLDFWRIQ